MGSPSCRSALCETATSHVRISHAARGVSLADALVFAYVMAYAGGGGGHSDCSKCDNGAVQPVPSHDQVNEESEPLTITGQRGNAVLVGEEDWQAIQETLFLASVPGLAESIRQARADGIEAGSADLDW